MHTKKLVSVVLLNFCFSSFCADNAVPLLEIKQDEKKAEQKQLGFDEYKAQGRLQLMSHGSWAQGDSKSARQLLVRALEVDHKDAADFYAARVSTLSVFCRLAADGNITLLGKLLPLLCRTPEFEVRHDRRNELTAFDCSGLMAAVYTTKDGKQKSEDSVRNIITAIINFYDPKEATCIEDSCLGPCTAQCQERRRAFLTYGLAQAGASAIELGYNYVIDVIYNTHQTFPTREAIKVAMDKKLLILHQKLEGLRATQLSNKDNCPGSSYALLRRFNCIADASKEASLHFISDYASQLAWPVIKNIRYNSWFGSFLSEMWAEPPVACVQLCPKK